MNPGDPTNPNEPGGGGPGGIDTGFGDGGLAMTDMGGTDDHAHDVVVTPDGLTVVVGSARPDANSLVNFALARYLHNGTLDPNFGDGGKVFTSFNESNSSSAQAVALQPDGKLVVAGYGPNIEAHHNTFAVARYNVDGSLDETFGDGGGVLTAIWPQTGAGPEDRANDVTIDAQGRILVAGETGSFLFDFAVARYLPDGSLDQSFGDGGIVQTDLGGDDRANAIAVQPDGSILVAGAGWLTGGDQASGAQEFAVIRYLEDGSFDHSFGDGGVVISDFRGGDDVGQELLLRADGRIGLAGTIQIGGGCQPVGCERYGFGMAQYLVDGTLDTSFGDGGKIEPDFIVSSGAYAAALMPDGVAALIGHIGNEDFGLAFARSSGGPILFPDGSEAIRIDFAGQSDRAFGAAAGPGNTVTLVGDASTPDGSFDFGVARYLAPTED